MFQRHIMGTACGLLLAVACFGVSTGAGAKDQAQLALGAGVFGFGVDSEPNNADGRIEYRFAHGVLGTEGIFRGFKPLVGASAQTSGSVFGYVGLAAPFVFGAGDRWEVVFEGGPGLYHQGASSLNLGGRFEFHLGLATSYAVTDNGRVGMGIYHISNGGTHRKNPGVNSIEATYTFAFDGP